MSWCCHKIRTNSMKTNFKLMSEKKVSQKLIYVDFALPCSVTQILHDVDYHPLSTVVLRRGNQCFLGQQRGTYGINCNCSLPSPCESYMYCSCYCASPREELSYTAFSQYSEQKKVQCIRIKRIWTDERFWKNRNTCLYHHLKVSYAFSSICSSHQYIRRS